MVRERERGGREREGREGEGRGRGRGDWEIGRTIALIMCADRKEASVTPSAIPGICLKELQISYNTSTVEVSNLGIN